MNKFKLGDEIISKNSKMSARIISLDRYLQCYEIIYIGLTWMSGGGRATVSFQEIHEDWVLSESYDNLSATAVCECGANFTSNKNYHFPYCPLNTRK